MKIVKTATAGTMESSDILVTVIPGEAEGIEIHLNSSVEKQFGRQIRSVIQQMCEEAGVESAVVEAVDKGALDCTIRARVKTAIQRASKEA